MRLFGAHKSALLATGVALAALLCGAASAQAAAGPIWSIQSAAIPTIMHTSDASGALVAVEAQGGTFTLTFDGQSTSAIADFATSASVESALDALSSIGGVGGSATVSTTADENNQKTYGVMFAGTLKGVSAATMTGTLSGGGSVTINAATNDEYDLHVQNIGDAASSGEITVTDKLPPGVTTTGTAVGLVYVGEGGTDFTCSSGAGLSEVTCTSTQQVPAGVTQAYNYVDVDVDAAGTFSVAIPVTVAAGASGDVTNTATVSGGGAARSASVSSSNPVNSSTPPEFGISYFNAQVSDEAGAPFTQAGGHPYAVTASFGFNEEIGPGVVGAAPNSFKNGAIDSVDEDEPREIAVDLPLGLVGNPLAAPRCPLNLTSRGTNYSACPRDTEVGIAYIGIQGGAQEDGPFAVFNVDPEPGRPGEFVFDPVASAIQVLYGTVVRTSLGNVVRIVAQVPRAEFHSISISFFANPIELFAQKGEDEEQVPFLINPTDCDASEAQRTMTMHVDSYYHPGALNPDGTPDFNDPNWKAASTVLPPVEGCSLLEFNPSSFELAPSGLLEGAHEAAAGGTTQADEPSAYEGRLKIPQLETFGTNSRPELKNATVTLPEGLSVSPSAANGLEGCTEEQLDLDSGEPGHCPEGSVLGTVEVETPLLEKPLQGHVYLAEPKCGETGEPECVEAEAEEGKLFGLIMELDGEAVIKLPGKVEAGGYGAYSKEHGLAPGQLRAVFENDPQLPFGELRFKFKEGPRTPLANPQTCGTYTTTSVLEPWSAPFSENATSQSPFDVSWDGKGGACPSSLPFSPGFTAGTQSAAAGTFSPLTLRFQREDREQDLSGITVHTPAGVVGDLTGVPPCAEAQANAGTCSSASEIGTVNTTVGPGADPFLVTGGRVYLTEGYKGDPFGLSIVVPANAGPFHLGNVVVRASIAIDPRTAELTISSNPLPQVVDGVPIRIRTIEVDVDRGDFMLNATNCAAQTIEATLTGLNGFNASSGSTASVSSPYAASGCAKLPFKPSLTAHTNASHNRRDGALLRVDVGSNIGEANIAKVRVELPKKLPSRLSTLQQACTEAQFAANPAGCPAGSVVGSVVVRTQVLPVPLEGPAYFVSHGGAKFPELVVVLQGDGVTIVLEGETFISKNGITSSTFNAVPDVPFETFQLTLPRGEHSALAGNGSLCEKPLYMPTTLTGQNGAVVTQKTKIEVSGCKPEIHVLGHSISGSHARIRVSVPAAGKLIASGRDLKRAVKHAAKAQTVTIRVSLGRHDLKVIAKHPRQRVNAKVKLRFVPKHGKPLSTHLKLLLR